MKKRRSVLMTVFLLFALLLIACGSRQQAFAETAQTVVSPEEKPAQPEGVETGEEDEPVKMKVTVGETGFTATLADNEAVDALVEMMESGPVVLQMRDYASFEKVGPLGKSLPASNRQMTTQAGDIVLYRGDQIVMFYGTNSWSYTRIGHIDDLTGWEDALGDGDVTVTFSMDNQAG